MNRRILSLLTALMLLCLSIPAAAETDATAFQGLWSLSYVIQDGQISTAAELGIADSLIIDGTTCRSILAGETLDTEAFTLGEDGLHIGNDVLELVAPDMILVRTENGTLILQRTGPVPFQSLFAGEWIVFMGYMNGQVYDAAAESSALCLTFTADCVIDEASGSELACVYTGSVCTITRPDGTTITASMDANGLITMTDNDSDVVLLLTRAE